VHELSWRCLGHLNYAYNAATDSRLVLQCSGTAVKVINFILFTPLLAFSSIAKICPVTILYYSTDFDLVIVVSLTHSYCVVMILQPVSLADFQLELNISGMYQLARHS